MLNIALTGNVAAGKSSVVRWFGKWGATIIDSDALVREAQRPGTETLGAIVRRFGSDVLRPDGSLDRAALRGKVMGDDDALAALNAIVHPAVRRRRAELVRQAADRGERILVNDIKKRLVRRGLSADEADRLIAAQLPAHRKRSRSDIVIDNEGSLNDLKQAARRAWSKISELAAEGLQQ